MNPKFRWLVHTAVQYNFPELFTFSVGDENFEQVVVCQLQSILRRVQAGECTNEKVLSSVSKRFGFQFVERLTPQHSGALRSMRMAQESNKEIHVPKSTDLKMASQGKRGSRRPDLQLYVPRARRSCPADLSSTSDPPDPVTPVDSLKTKTKPTSKQTPPIRLRKTSKCETYVDKLMITDQLSSDEIMSIESNENSLTGFCKNDHNDMVGYSLQNGDQCNTEGTCSSSVVLCSPVLPNLDNEMVVQTQSQNSLLFTPEQIVQDDCTTQSCTRESPSEDVTFADVVIECCGASDESMEVAVSNPDNTVNEIINPTDTSVLPVAEPSFPEVLSPINTRLKEVVKEKESVEQVVENSNIELSILPGNKASERPLGTVVPPTQIPVSTQIPTADSWDSLFDENGDCVEPSVLQGLSSALGEVKIQKPKIDYLDFQPQDPDLSEESYDHILELYNFPAEFKTPDLMMAFSVFKERGFDIKWVDDTHALAIFASSVAASQALEMHIPFIKVRPVSQAISKSKFMVAKKLDYLLPPKPRPETSASLARRMITGALGMRSQVTREQRESERRKLQVAKENKRQVQKLKQDIWNGSVS